jgi:DOPA 4,5-dioxygenase
LTDRALPEEVIMAASVDSLHGYHVHIYYKDETLAAAQALRDRLAASFPVQIGKNAGIAGPHPVPQIQIIFKKEAFQQVVPWLMLNRDGLDILVHPLSNNEYDDHTDYALWMGTPIKLKVETLPHGPYPARLLPVGAEVRTRLAAIPRGIRGASIGHHVAQDAAEAVPKELSSTSRVASRSTSGNFKCSAPSALTLSASARVRPGLARGEGQGKPGHAT